MNSPSNSPLGGHLEADDRTLVRTYCADNPRLSAGALSAARHFLKWARARKIPIRDLDASAVDRFLRHRCRCDRYSPTQLKCPVYAADTRRFLRYLEDSGVVMIADDVARLGQYLQAYAGKLSAARYSEVTYSMRLSQARHFAEWALQMRVPAHGIDDAIGDQFAHHDCRCGIKTKRGKRVEGSGTRDRRRGARAFVRFLREQSLIPPAAPDCVTACDPRLTEFSEWLRRERGVTSETVRRYVNEAGRWLDRLVAAQKDYDAAAIRSIVLDQGEEWLGFERKARSSIFGVPDGDFLEILDAPEISVATHGTQVKACYSKGFRAYFAVPGVKSAEIQIGFAIRQPPGFYRVEIVYQEYKDIAVGGIKRRRVLRDIDVWVVDAGRPIEHAGHLPSHPSIIPMDEYFSLLRNYTYGMTSARRARTQASSDNCERVIVPKMHFIGSVEFWSSWRKFRRSEVVFSAGDRLLGQAERPLGCACRSSTEQTIGEMR